MMTTQNKILIGIGSALALGAGYMIYNKSKKDKPTEFKDTSQEPTIATPPIVGPRTNVSKWFPTMVLKRQPQPTGRNAETIGFKIGQMVKATTAGTQTYVPIKQGDGNFRSDGKKQTFFNQGDIIGEIIWVGRKQDKTFRYVVKRTGGYGVISYHWIADTRHIAPHGTDLGVINYDTKAIGAGLDKNRILTKGMFDNDEVKELQRLLGVTKPDGDFGKNTEALLLKVKGVTKIRLSEF